MYVNPHKIHENLWRCDCGKEFDKSSSLTSHATHCKLYKKIDKKSKYKCNDIYICECGYTNSNYQSFNAHLSHCDIHHSKVGTVRKLRKSEINHSMCWENKSEEEISEIYKRMSNTRKIKFQQGLIKNNFDHHTEKSKEKIRKSTVCFLNKIIPGFKARYNPNACIFINELNIKNNWNLQHAENGGEVECLGYFLDGYDKNLNIVFEYDEPGHYKDVYNNILNEKDIIRQQNIINELHCEFWRYNEKMNLLYKITNY